MVKQSGLGDNLYVGGYDLSGDIGSLSRIGGGPAALDVTAINKSGFERIGGVRGGSIEFSAFFDPAEGAAHPVLSALPTTDIILTYCRGTALGSPAACQVSKQIDYAPTRAADGALTIAVAAQSNGYGIEWGRQLTPGLRTDTEATNGSSIDTGASADFGAQAYLQVTAFTGTDATIKIQDSADDSSWADVSGLAFTEVTSGPVAERVWIANTATVRRYVRVATTTTGGFTSLTFSVVVVKNEVEGVVF
jgi:hypothetical protein